MNLNSSHTVFLVPQLKTHTWVMHGSPAVHSVFASIKHTSPPIENLDFKLSFSDPHPSFSALLRLVCDMHRFRKLNCETAAVSCNAVLHIATLPTLEVFQLLSAARDIERY